MSADELILDREQVEAFLLGFQRRLVGALANRDAVRSQVARLADKTGIAYKESEHWAGKRPDGGESAFIGEYVMPTLEASLRESEMRRDKHGTDPLNLIRVGFAAPKRYRTCGAVPSHPFGKLWRTPEEVYDRWIGKGKHSHVPLIQSYPDVNLLSPYRILFECKYFNSNPKNPARVQLVKDLRETFFYLGLPALPSTPKQAARDFRYGCYLAYDASDRLALSRAWSDLPAKVRNSFWDQANIFVMVFPEST